MIVAMAASSQFSSSFMYYSESKFTSAALSRFVLYRLIGRMLWWLGLVDVWRCRRPVCGAGSFAFGNRLEDAGVHLLEVALDVARPRGHQLVRVMLVPLILRGIVKAHKHNSQNKKR